MQTEMLHIILAYPGGIVPPPLNPEGQQALQQLLDEGSVKKIDDRLYPVRQDIGKEVVLLPVADDVLFDDWRPAIKNLVLIPSGDTNPSAVDDRLSNILREVIAHGTDQETFLKTVGDKIIKVRNRHNRRLLTLDELEQVAYRFVRFVCPVESCRAVGFMGEHFKHTSYSATCLKCDYEGRHWGLGVDLLPDINKGYRMEKYLRSVFAVGAPVVTVEQWAEKKNPPKPKELTQEAQRQADWKQWKESWQAEKARTVVRELGLREYPLMTDAEAEKEARALSRIHETTGKEPITPAQARSIDAAIRRDYEKQIGPAIQHIVKYTNWGTDGIVSKYLASLEESREVLEYIPEEERMKLRQIEEVAALNVIDKWNEEPKAVEFAPQELYELKPGDERNMFLTLHDAMDHSGKVLDLDPTRHSLIYLALDGKWVVDVSAFEEREEICVS